MQDELENYVKDRLPRELLEIMTSERGSYDLPISHYERAIIYKYTDDGFEDLKY